MRGILGKKNSDANRNRYKYDALDYYEVDIEWLSFVTVPIGLCVTGILISTKIARRVEDSDYYMIAVILAQRIIQLFLMSPFRNQYLLVEAPKIWKWGILGCFDLVALYFFFKQKNVNVVSGIFIIDFVTLIL